MFVISSGVYIAEISTVFEVLEAVSHCSRSCANMVEMAENGELTAACKGHKLVVQGLSSCSIQVVFLISGSIQRVSPMLMFKRFVFWVVLNDLEHSALFMCFCIKQDKAIALFSKGYKILCCQSFSYFIQGFASCFNLLQYSFAHLGPSMY